MCMERGIVCIAAWGQRSIIQCTRRRYNYKLENIAKNIISNSEMVDITKKLEWKQERSV